jgi:hypothetical protein
MMPDQTKLFHSDHLALSPDAKPRPFSYVECFCGTRFRVEDFRAMGKLCDRCKQRIIDAGGTVYLPGGLKIQYTGEICEDPSSAA